MASRRSCGASSPLYLVVESRVALPVAAGLLGMLAETALRWVFQKSARDRHLGLVGLGGLRFVGAGFRPFCCFCLVVCFGLLP